MKRDLSVFMKLSSLGAVCVLTMICFVVIYGLIGLYDTEHVYNFAPTVENDDGLLW